MTITEALGSVSLQHLELLGRGYVIDYCIAFFRRKNERLLYEVYITDALKAIADNTAKLPAEGGKTMQKRYAEIVQENNISPAEAQENAKKDKRTADEIIRSMKNKINKLGG